MKTINSAQQQLFGTLVRLSAALCREALTEVAKNPPPEFDRLLARVNSGELTPFLIVSAIPRQQITFAVGNGREVFPLFELIGTEIRPSGAALN